jgi:hypothetical protein
MGIVIGSDASIIVHSQLNPLVFLGQKTAGGVDEKPKQGYPGAEKMKAGGGLDAELYEKIRPEVLSRRVVYDQTQSSLTEVKKERK